MEISEIKKIVEQRVIGIFEADHDTSGHRYRNTKTGSIQRSVTTKLQILSKPHLIRWAVKVGIEWLKKEDRWQRLLHESWAEEMISGAQMAHTEIRDDAGGVGTQAHNAIESFINDWIASGKKPVSIVSFARTTTSPDGRIVYLDDPRAIASMRAVEAFFNKHNIIPLFSEILVGDDRYSAGTLDFLCIMNGKLTLLDWKTSNAVDAISYSAQVAAYKYFFELMTGLKIKQTKILHLSKDYDKFTVYKVLRIPEAWKAFKHICGTYDWMYGPGEKIEKDIKKLKI